MNTSLQSLASGKHEASGSATILIVDDEEYARTTLMDVLEEMGYRVEGAGTAAEALSLARATSFDIALLDLRLPDMKGTDLLTQMKSICPETACIMVTAYASLDTSLYALNQGASGYVQKPFEMPEIIRVICEQMEKQRLSRENRRMVQALQALQSISDIALSTLEPKDFRPGSWTALCRQRAATAAPFTSRAMRTTPADPCRRVRWRACPSGDAEWRAGLIPAGMHAPCMAVPSASTARPSAASKWSASEQGFTRTDLELAELLADRTASPLRTLGCMNANAVPRASRRRSTTSRSRSSRRSTWTTACTSSPEPWPRWPAASAASCSCCSGADRSCPRAPTASPRMRQRLSAR